MGLIKGLFNMIGLGLYCGDNYSDIRLAIFFFSEGHIIWGCLTIFFVVGPLILANISAYYGINRATRGADAAKRYEQFGYLSYKKVRLVCCFTLTLPLALMIYSIPDVFRGKDNKCTLAGQGMKLMEVYLESLPQSLLQGFIIAQVLYGGATGVPVDWKQWTSLAISITSLAFSIATGYMCARKTTGYGFIKFIKFKEPSPTSKVVFFLLGGLALSARILVCSLWALISKPLWAVPFTCNIAIAVAVWCTKKCCSCGPCVELDFHTHDGDNLSKKGIVILTWVTTAMFNAFTTSGALVSAGNVGLAIGSYFLVPGTNVALAGMIAIVLSSVSLAGNLILVLVPALRRTVGDDWLLIDDRDRSTFY